MHLGIAHPALGVVQKNADRAGLEVQGAQPSAVTELEHVGPAAVVAEISVKMTVFARLTDRENDLVETETADPLARPRLFRRIANDLNLGQLPVPVYFPYFPRIVFREGLLGRRFGCVG